MHPKLATISICMCDAQQNAMAFVINYRDVIKRLKKIFYSGNIIINDCYNNHKKKSSFIAILCLTIEIRFRKFSFSFV